MKKTKIIAILTALVIMTAMTGIVAADPETIEKLQDGAPPDVLQVQPWIIDNTGANNNMDIKFSQYLDCALAGDQHTLTVTVVPLSGFGGLQNDLTITLTERSGAGFTLPTQGGATLLWNQDGAGSAVFDYIDMTVTSSGPDNAKYNLNIVDSYTCGQTTDGELVTENQQVNNIPEFATIAIPTVAILGLFLFFNHRKQKKE